MGEKERFKDLLKPYKKEYSEFRKKPRARYPLRFLEYAYEKGFKEPLEDLVWAWYRVTTMKPGDEDYNEYHSFFAIGGIHGQPFGDEGATDGAYWGGYCNHANILFPTWHRAYVKRMEEALQSINPKVTLPFWDEVSEETEQEGIPKTLTQAKFTFTIKPNKGLEIDNPLIAYVLPEDLGIAPGNKDYHRKPKGYKTVRYPLCGHVFGRYEHYCKWHNAKYSDHKENTKLLNENMKHWIVPHKNIYYPKTKREDAHPQGIRKEFEDCIKVKDYTLFSNTSSSSKTTDMPLESPHNAVHLAVGGFEYLENGEEPGHWGVKFGASGDMGENTTASLDPIFFFHHCHVDRVFWRWQMHHGKTDDLGEINYHLPGTSVKLGEGQGVARMQKEGEILTFDTPLYPFQRDLEKHPDDPTSYYTSRDVVNIETQMLYTYKGGHVFPPTDVPARKGTSEKLLYLSGLNKASIRGSFVVNAQAKVGDRVYQVGTIPVLSRLNIERCMNCQSNLPIEKVFRLDMLTDDEVDKAKFYAKIGYHPAGNDADNVKQVEQNISLKVGNAY